MKWICAVPVAAMAVSAANWDIQLAPPSEPGQRLVVMGHVRKDKGAPPLAGVHVYAYHADGKGFYALPGHEKEGPRLAGTAVTNERGEYRIRTILPGVYSGGPAHIHFEVWGKGLSRKAFIMNLQPPTAMGALPPLSDTGSLYDRYHERLERQPPLSGTFGYPVVRDAKGTLHGAFDIVMSQGYTIPGSK